MDRVIFLGCFLLLAVGVLTGLGMGSSAGLPQSIRSALELLSFAGTAVTAVVALIALTSWQTQFRHSEKWKALKAFQDSLDAGMSAHTFLMYLFTLIAQNQSANWMNKQIDIPAEFMQKQKDWMEYCTRVDKAWSQIELLYGEGDLRAIENHRAIEDDVRKLSTMMLELYLKMEPTNLLELHNAAQGCVVNASKRTRALYDQSGRLLKGLVA